MSTPSNALQAAIYARLTGFSALTALIGAGKVYDFVPQAATAPYVVIGDDTLTFEGTKTENGWDCTLTIHCWDFEKAGRKSVKSILSAIYDALHRQEASIAVTDFTLVELRSEFEETFQDTTVEGANDRFYHGVARYRALIESI
ncbi:DUF3168 domain-containing protein [Tundrisphaera lichenicola]|uniref:DUF3168 domain-containing protein n=1 Tax=Tundrisphaera lichenicola TaxID=2029860 RepID=UPI003EC12C6F